MIDKKLDEYLEAFGDVFPTIPLMMGRSDEEVIKIIDECLKKGKDVYKLGYVEEGYDIEY